MISYLKREIIFYLFLKIFYSLKYNYYHRRSCSTVISPYFHLLLCDCVLKGMAIY